MKTPAVRTNGLAFSMSGARKPKDDAEEGQEKDNAEDDEEGSEEKDQASSEDESMHDAEDLDEAVDGESAPQEHDVPETKSRKRKRGGAEDNLEEAYMRRVAKEEAKEAEKRRAEKAKRRKVENEEDASSDEDGSDEDESSDAEDDEDRPPVHEALTGESEAAAIDKSNRTVFLGNVSTKAIKSKSAKKILLRHLASFLPTLPEADKPHKVESLRFRSTPFATPLGVPKRAAYAKKEIMDATTPSTNAYVVYSTTQAARKAPAALNGSIVLDRHLRVDSVAHPAEVDHKRCVFVGNLDFVDEEPNESSDEGSDEESKDKKKKKKKKRSAPADVEEGLWRTFNEHTGTSSSSNKGNVESVRVVRDRATRVGKGFAYVQFYDPNCVEAALLLDGKKFPPLLPRKLRVVRAKKVKKKPSQGAGSGANATELGGARMSLHGRAEKLLGRGGAAKLKAADSKPKSATDKPLVFEGQRASESGPKFKVKTKSRGAAKGKPKTRSSRRGAAFRAAGGKKVKAKK